MLNGIDEDIDIVTAELLGNPVTSTTGTTVTLLQVRRTPGNVDMVDGNGTFLSIDTRTKGRGTAEENADLTVVHILNHLLTLLLILRLLDETDFSSRNTIVIDELVLDLLEDIPLARLIGGKVAEDKLRTFLLVILLIIVGNHAGAMACLIVGVITETLLGNKAHIQRGLTAGIGSNKHLALFLPL